MTVTQELSEFAEGIQYADLPPAANREAKRLLLDTIGCAIGGIETTKGRLALQMARALGGPPEAAILGFQEKVSASVSAYANGELMNALDYDALLSPPEHATPYVLAAPLAVAEMRRVSGKDLILSTAIAHEMTIRIAASLVFGKRFNIELPERGIAMSIPTPGYGLCIFSGTAAAARLLGLKAKQIAHAIGIAGYHAPVPMLMKFCMVVPAGIPKYLSSGILSQQEVMAAQSAAMGCTGDPDVLDGPYGFWRAFGCDSWRQEIITEGLGRAWYYPERLFYKTYPCCGAMQNGLALFEKIVLENGLGPGEISEVHVRMNMLAELPVWRAQRVENHIDAQFNVPFVFSLVAHRIEAGPSWQTEDTIRDQCHVEFMKKVRVWTELDAGSRERPAIEVVVGSGKERKVFSRTGAMAYEMSDDVLLTKFIRNTRRFLGEERARRASELLQRVEDLDDVGLLFEQLSAHGRRG
jgi:2-methylcitrate dehydratase PrpD